MKTKLQNELKKIAPSISVQTIWEHDEDATWDCDGDLDPDDFQAWQSEVKASAIVGGELVEGSAYLCGTWEKFGEHPSKSNPEISGYELQMTEEALQELCKLVPFIVGVQIKRAIGHCQEQMQKRYDAQMKAKAA